jgi:hypothetical protein
MTQQPIVNVDAATFQKPLQELAEVLSQKVKREAPKRLAAAFVAFDLHVLIRQAQRTYDLMFYLNADERREKDCYWRPAYSVKQAFLAICEAKGIEVLEMHKSDDSFKLFPAPFSQ